MLAPKQRFLNLVIVLGIVLSGCTVNTLSVQDLHEPEVWGGMDRVVGLGDLYIAGQPDEPALDEAQRRGVAAIINLRGEDEFDWDEAQAAGDRGIAYYQVPVSGRVPDFDPEVIGRISGYVKQHQGEPVLVHCASGNRAAAWLAIYLVEHHGLKTEDALAISRQAGLSYTPFENMIRRYVGDDIPAETQ